MLTLSKILFVLLIKSISSTSTDQRIVGGRLAKLGEFPYQVSLRRSYNDGHFCGGSIITPLHVLTAAHCCFYAWGGVLPPIVVSVLVGQLLLENKNDTVYRNATRIFIHPRYDPNTMENDIAIVELDRELPRDNKLINKVLLRRIKAPDNSSCTVSGWGVVTYNSFVLSRRLLTTTIYVLDHEECQRRYSAADVVLFPGMLCAVNDEKPADACQGDSGGPLVCDGYLTGVISTGKECANSSFPGVYSDVRYFLPWIEETIKSFETTEVDNLIESSTTAIKLQISTEKVGTTVAEGWNISNLFSSATLQNLKKIVTSLVFLTIIENLFM